jgi:hypothetical protein
MDTFRISNKVSSNLFSPSITGKRFTSIKRKRELLNLPTNTKDPNMSLALPSTHPTAHPSLPTTALPPILFLPTTFHYTTTSHDTSNATCHICKNVCVKNSIYCDIHIDPIYHSRMQQPISYPPLSCPQFPYRYLHHIYLTQSSYPQSSYPQSSYVVPTHTLF